MIMIFNIEKIEKFIFFSKIFNLARRVNPLINFRLGPLPKNLFHDDLQSLNKKFGKLIRKWAFIFRTENQVLDKKSEF